MGGWGGRRKPEIKWQFLPVTVTKSLIFSSQHTNPELNDYHMFINGLAELAFMGQEQNPLPSQCTTLHVPHGNGSMPTDSTRTDTDVSNTSCIKGPLFLQHKIINSPLAQKVVAGGGRTRTRAPFTTHSAACPCANGSMPNEAVHTFPINSAWREPCFCNTKG